MAEQVLTAIRALSAFLETSDGSWSIFWTTILAFWWLFRDARVVCTVDGRWFDDEGRGP